MKLMGHVRALLLENPEITNDQLMAVLSPLYPSDDRRWLRKTVAQYRWKITRMARIKAEIFNNDTEPTDRYRPKLDDTAS